MNTTDPIVHDGELTAEAAYILGQILGAWIIFSESHDLESPKIACCEKTKNLFKALSQYEKLIKD